MLSTFSIPGSGGKKSAGNNVALFDLRAQLIAFGKLHDVLAKIQLGSHPGDQAALGHLDEFFSQAQKVPVTFGTSGYVRNLDALRKRLFEQTSQSHMPAKRVCL